MNLPQRYDDLHWTERKKVREEYVKLQNGKCWHCKGNLDEKSKSFIGEESIRRKLFPASFFKWPVHLHHCHKTGLTIGAVHAHCNAVLWQYHGE